METCAREIVDELFLHETTAPCEIQFDVNSDIIDQTDEQFVQHILSLDELPYHGNSVEPATSQVKASCIQGVIKFN